MKKSMIALSFLSLFTFNAQAENTFVWTQKADIPTLDPYAFASTTALGFQNHIYEGLIEWDDNFKLSPVLAESWEQVDNQTIIFKLRKGVIFHNGNPFDADDVIASFKRIMDKDSGIRGNVSSIVKAEKVNDFEVKITTVPNSPIALNELTGVMMMDKEWLVENNATKPSSMSNGTESYATNNTNGTGPFKLDSRRRDVGMTLSVNKNWWNNAHKRHNIDIIKFKPVTSDATRIAGLMSNEFHLTTDVPLQDVKRIEQDKNLSVMTMPSMRVVMLSFNQADQLNAKNESNKNPLQDVRVRQALTYAVDRELIVKKIMRNMTKVSNAYISPLIAGYDEGNNIDITYDPSKAKALLKDAGYENGFNIAFDCVSGAYISAEQWCPAIQRFWAKVGINSDLAMHPRSTYSTIRDQGKTDVGVLGWANLPLVDAYSINQQLIHSKDGGIYGSFNIPNYKNEKVDALIEKASTEINQEKRLQLMSEGLDIAQQDLPYLPLHFEPVVWAVNSHIDIKQSSDNVVRLWKVKFH